MQCAAGCKIVLEPNARFCSECGGRAVAKTNDCAPTGVATCSSGCTIKQEPGAKFCRECGGKLEVRGSPTATQLAPGSTFKVMLVRKGSGSCASCGKEVTGRSLVVGGIPYHPPCLECSKCARPQSAGDEITVKDNDTFWCSKCVKYHEENLAKKQHQVTYTPFSVGVKVEKCAGCNLNLDPAFAPTVHQGKLYHPTCVPNPDKMCSRCSKPLFGSFVKALDRKWHKECFNCASCSGLLTKGHVPLDNEPYCVSCAKEKMGGSSQVINKQPEKQPATGSCDARPQPAGTQVNAKSSSAAGKSAFCGDCGSKLDGHTFCGECGARN